MGHKYNKVVEEKLRSPSPSCAPGIGNTRKSPVENLGIFFKPSVSGGFEKDNFKTIPDPGIKYSEENDSIS